MSPFSPEWLGMDRLLPRDFDSRRGRDPLDITPTADEVRFVLNNAGAKA